jgi:transcriptional regulator with XRE-family HTH domain
MRALLLEHERAFGRNVARLREERDWSQAELARRLTALGFEMHQTTVAKLEAGKRPVRLAEMYALAQVFELPPSVMFSPPNETALLELLAKYEESYLVATARRTSCNAIAVEIEEFLAVHPDARAALIETLRKAFSDRPDFDDATSFLRRQEQALMPQPTRWWNFFTMMHGAYGELSKGSPNLLSANDDAGLAAAELEAERRRANRNGEHQETT